MALVLMGRAETIPSQPKGKLAKGELVIASPRRERLRIILIKINHINVVVESNLRTVRSQEEEKAVLDQLMPDTRK